MWIGLRKDDPRRAITPLPLAYFYPFRRQNQTLLAHPHLERHPSKKGELPTAGRLSAGRSAGGSSTGGGLSGAGSEGSAGGACGPSGGSVSGASGGTGSRISHVTLTTQRFPFRAGRQTDRFGAGASG